MFNPKHSYCQKTKSWSLVYTDGKSKFCSLCRVFDTKQHNGFKAWNSTPSIKCHIRGEKGNNVEKHFKVFKTLYWLAKEEITSTKITVSYNQLIKMGVDDLKYFQTRSESVLGKILLLIAKTIIQSTVVKIKRSDI